MIIYEVNLIIQNKIFDEYMRWLKNHITDMLKFDGFIRAETGLIKEDNQQAEKTIRINYLIESEKQLENYLKEHAATVRNHAVKKFGSQFSASRRIIIPVE